MRNSARWASLEALLSKATFSIRSAFLRIKQWALEKVRSSSPDCVPYASAPYNEEVPSNTASEAVRSPLVPGEDGTPVPPGEWVIRVGFPSKDGNPNAKIFELSSADKADLPVRLSVYAECVTSHDDAWRLTGAKSKYNQIYRLNVDSIREIPSANALPQTATLDVEWATAYLPGEGNERRKDDRAGAEGHCGIRHMDVGTKTQRARIREQLASISKIQALPPELLRTADDFPQHEA
jgi:hypothetical protein